MASSIKTLGVPKEIKTLEGRVSLTPDGVREFERLGIEVFVEKSAGEGASITDAEYVAAGATIVPTAADAWSQQMVVKVKEPKAEEFGFLRPDPHCLHTCISRLIQQLLQHCKSRRQQPLHTRPCNSKTAHCHCWRR